MDNYTRANSRRRGRMSKGQKLAFGAVVVLYTVILSVVSFVFLGRPSAGMRETYTATDENGNTITQTVTPEDGEYNILVLGMDKEAMLTDVMMLVHISDNAHKINVIQIPRDTYISGAPGITSRTHKINELYADYYNSHGYDSKAAIEFVKETLRKSLCVTIHEAALMDLSGFVNIVDIIGGVPIDVPAAMNYTDGAQNLYINIPAGRQVLDGKNAEGFVRYRDGYAQGDMGRVNAQKLFLTAFFERLKSTVSVSNVTDIAGEILKNLETDMSVGDMVLYARMLLNCDLSGIKLRTMPGFTEAGMNHYVLNRAEALRAVNEDLNTNKDGDISGAVFDSAQLFNNSGDPSISGIYYGSDIYDEKIYGGDTVGGEINIPRKKGK